MLHFGPKVAPCTIARPCRAMPDAAIKTAFGKHKQLQVTS